MDMVFHKHLLFFYDFVKSGIFVHNFFFQVTNVHKATEKKFIMAM